MADTGSAEIPAGPLNFQTPERAVAVPPVPRPQPSELVRRERPARLDRFRPVDVSTYRGPINFGQPQSPATEEGRVAVAQAAEAANVVEPIHHRHRAGISTWLVGIPLLSATACSYPVGSSETAAWLGVAASAVVALPAVAMTGFYVLITGRPSWMRMNQGRASGAKSVAISLISLIAILLVARATAPAGSWIS